jgi:hypothetical protein
MNNCFKQIGGYTFKHRPGSGSYHESCQKDQEEISYEEGLGAQMNLEMRSK